MRRDLRNIFSDKTSLVLRAFLREPEKKWTFSDLVSEGVSLGLASLVINKAEAAGYIERVRRVNGESYCRLIRKELLLEEWVESYSFEKNIHTYYYYPGKIFFVGSLRLPGRKTLNTP